MAGVLAMMQDLAAVVLQVPFVDLLSTMTDANLPLTKHEADEWGDPATSEGLRTLRDHCPYQSIRKAAYPPVFVTCASNDVRVPAFGPAKWAAKLRAQQSAGHPILLAPRHSGGHFGHDQSELDEAAIELAVMMHAVTARRRT